MKIEERDEQIKNLYLSENLTMEELGSSSTDFHLSGKFVGVSA
jgi:hypothetical protein